MCEGESQRLIEIHDKSSKRQSDPFENNSLTENFRQGSGKINDIDNSHLVFEGCSLILIPRELVKVRLAIANGNKLSESTALEE